MEVYIKLTTKERINVMGWKFWAGIGTLVVAGIATIGLITTGVGIPAAVAEGTVTLKAALGAMGLGTIMDATLYAGGIAAVTAE